jgi:hypothetical protein
MSIVLSRIFGVRNKLVTPTTLWGSLGAVFRVKLELRFSVIFLCKARKSCGEFPHFCY